MALLKYKNKNAFCFVQKSLFVFVMVILRFILSKIQERAELLYRFLSHQVNEHCQDTRVTKLSAIAMAAGVLVF